MPDDRKRMNATFEEARTRYYDVDLAERSQVAAARSVVQQGGANESYNSSGGGSCGMVCGQMCGMCGQACVMVCGQMCGMCGIACVMVCGGMVCAMVCGYMCGTCGCCGGATAGGQPLKVILVQEQPEVDVSAGGSKT
jgi:hypothetical protein